MSGHSLHNGNSGRSFRFRADDGDETDTGSGATWLAAVNTWISWPINGGKFRLRFGIDHAQPDAAQDHLFQMAYRFGSGSYTDLYPEGHGSEQYIQGVASDHLTNNEDTTEHTPKLWTVANFYGTPNACVITDDANWRTGTIEYPKTPNMGLSIEVCIEPIEGDLVAGNFIQFRPYRKPLTAFYYGYDYTAQVTFTAATGGASHPYITQANRQRTLGRILTR